MAAFSVSRLTKFVAAIAVLCMPTLPATAEPPAKVEVAVPYLPPWGYLEPGGTPAGIAVDFARAILDRAGLKGEVMPLKPDQLQELGNKGPAVMIVARGGGASPLMPIAKLVTVETVAVASPGVQLRTQDDLATIGPVAVATRSQFNLGLLTQPHLDILEAPSIEDALRLLEAGQVKAVVGFAPVVDAVARKLHMEGKLGNRVTLQQGEGWLVANPAAGAPSRPAAAALERAARELVADGTMERLLMDGLIAEAQSGRCDEVIVSGDPDYEPVSWYDGTQLRGAAEAIVARALDRAGIPFEFRYGGPFKRGLAAAEMGGIDIVAELKRTPEREEFLDFPATSIFTNPVAVFTRRDRNLTIHRREDLVGLEGGIILDNRFGGGLDEDLAKNLAIEELQSLDRGLNVVEANHLHYFMTSYYPGMSYLQNRHQAGMFTVEQPYLVIAEDFVGVSKKSPCLSGLGALDGVLAKMRQEGEIARLFDSATEVRRQQIDPNE
jgi:polar amino acid transport system substrate-binding protein